MERPLVMHILGRLDVGGAELRTLELYRGIHDEVDFAFVVLTGEEGVLDESFRALGAQIYPLRLRSAGFIYRYVSLLRRENPDIIQSHVATFSGALLLLARLSGIPRRVAHFRSDGDAHGNNLRRRIQRGAMRLLISLTATDIVGVSPGALSHGYGRKWLDDRRAQVIPNGFPVEVPELKRSLRSEFDIPSDALLVMHVGRPSPEKNRPFAVTLMSKLLQQGENAHLVLVGGRGADSEAMATLIARLHIEERVHLAGECTDARGLMTEADILVLPSLREGLPGVVVESLSVGTPVYASDLPGTRYIATELPGVGIAPLPADADIWAVGLLKHWRSYRSQQARAELAEAFAKSDFTLDSSLERYRLLYLGNEQAEATTRDNE